MSDLTATEQRIAGISLGYLERCTSVGTTVFAEILTQPRPGSIAQASMGDKDLMEPFLTAGMYLHVALDHYLALRAMFVRHQVPAGAPVPELRNLAPYTLVRGALEADAWACWLLDPAPSAVERLGRAMTVRALNLREVRRLGLRFPDGERVDYRTRIARVTAVAQRHGLAEKWNIEGDLVWVGSPRPDASALLGEVLPDKSEDTNGEPLGWHTYSLLSARAHGNPWAVLHNIQSAERFGDHASSAEVVIDVMELMRLLRISLRVHSEAIRRATVLDDRDPADWERQRGPTAEARMPPVS